MLRIKKICRFLRRTVDGLMNEYILHIAEEGIITTDAIMERGIRAGFDLLCIAMSE